MRWPGWTGGSSRCDEEEPMREELAAVREQVLVRLRGAPSGRSIRRSDLVEKVQQALRLTGCRWSKGTVDRRVREVLTELDREGHPIISDGAGYRIAKSRTETEAYSERLAKQGLALLRRSALIRRLPVGELVQSMLPLGDVADG